MAERYLQTPGYPSLGADFSAVPVRFSPKCL
jgi:hypothetical protein